MTDLESECVLKFNTVQNALYERDITIMLSNSTTDQYIGVIGLCGETLTLVGENITGPLICLAVKCTRTQLATSVTQTEQYSYLFFFFWRKIILNFLE